MNEFKLQNLEKQISELPAGYISKKTINNKIRYYRQWNEDGKLKSKYIPESEYEETVKAISCRKELEKELKKLKKGEKSHQSIAIDFPLSLEMQALYGETLKKYCALVAEWQERDCCVEIRSYLFGKVTPRVCVVYGLRRTGKTTMLLQVIGRMSDEDFSKAVYIKARKKQTMNMLDRDLKRLYEAGFRYIFLDEVTLLEDFIDTASFLPDIYAGIGMKIVLSGTDSLGLWFANREELYDRTYMIHTTWIPYAEHARLLGIRDIDGYIHYGGTLRIGETDFDDLELKNEEVSFRDDETTRRYIDTAICGNIQHSLKCYEGGEHFRHLRELYENDELTGAINRVIESMNHRFVLDVLTRTFRSNDLALARKNMLRERDPALRTDVLDRIDLPEVTGKLMEILSIRNRQDMKTALKESHVSEIREYLKALELIEVYSVRYAGSAEEPDEQIIITQPGLRYCQAQALIFSLMKDPALMELDSNVKTYVSGKILDEVKGRMMEEIVLLETMRRKRNCDVFKLVFDVGEFDMVVSNRNSGKCGIYEIKHSTECIPEQTRHICDEDKYGWTESKIGKINGRYVIYRGESRTLENGVRYLNVSEYLSNPDGAIASGCIGCTGNQFRHGKAFRTL